MFPCFRHEGLVSDNRFRLQVALVKIVPEDSGVLQFLRGCYGLRNDIAPSRVATTMTNNVMSPIVSARSPLVLLLDGVCFAAWQTSHSLRILPNRS